MSPYSEETCTDGASAAGPTSPLGGELGASFTNPTNGATVEGVATVTLKATGGTGYNFKVTVDDAQLYAGTNPSFSWNTTTAANGTRALTATVTDARSRTAVASLTVTVANSSPTPPRSPGAGFTVSFIYPASGRPSAEHSRSGSPRLRTGHHQNVHAVGGRHDPDVADVPDRDHVLVHVGHDGGRQWEPNRHGDRDHERPDSHGHASRDGSKQRSDHGARTGHKIPE